MLDRASDGAVTSRSVRQHPLANTSPAERPVLATIRTRSRREPVESARAEKPSRRRCKARSRLSQGRRGGSDLSPASGLRARSAPALHFRWRSRLRANLCPPRSARVLRSCARPHAASAIQKRRLKSPRARRRRGRQRREDGFLAQGVSHEIRTPLTHFWAFSEVMLGSVSARSANDVYTGPIKDIHSVRSP